MWRAVPRLSVRLLRAEQLRVALVTPTHPSEEVWGPLIWQGALTAGRGGSEQFLDVKSCTFNSPGVGGLKRGFLMAVMVLHSPETFSAILTLEDPLQRGVGGIALLTLSDTEDALHFLLLFRGLLGGE